jgi:hypothetical protein
MLGIGLLLERLLTLSSRPERLERISSGLHRLLLAVDAKRRAQAARSASLPAIQSIRGETLGYALREPAPPWSGEDLGECDVPGMVTPEECAYYLYIGRFYAGFGEVVELGPWLGRSTTYICRGLAQNSTFAGRRVRVFDDFVWRSSWMDDRVQPVERLPNHADFLGLFERYARPLEPVIDVAKRKITTYDGNDAVAQLEWAGEPVEIIYVDCGRTFEANEAWWRIFSPSFVAGRTLVVLQDWATHREVPVMSYNQIKHWVDSKGAALQIVHELKHGGIATFVYTGERASR